MTSEQAAQLALECEAAALAVDKPHHQQRGASVSAPAIALLYGPHAGLSRRVCHSRHSLAVSPIAGKGGDMQRDIGTASMRHAGEMASPEAVGRYASERALSRLRAQDCHGAMPGAVRITAGCGLVGFLRAGRQRRRAVPQEHVPAGQPEPTVFPTT